MKSQTNGGLRFGVKAFVLILSCITFVMLFLAYTPKLGANAVKKAPQAPVASAVQAQKDPNEAVLAQFGLTFEGAHQVSSSVQTNK